MVYRKKDRIVREMELDEMDFLFFSEGMHKVRREGAWLFVGVTGDDAALKKGWIR